MFKSMSQLKLEMRPCQKAHGLKPILPIGIPHLVRLAFAVADELTVDLPATLGQVNTNVWKTHGYRLLKKRIYIILLIQIVYVSHISEFTPRYCQMFMINIWQYINHIHRLSIDIYRLSIDIYRLPID